MREMRTSRNRVHPGHAEVFMCRWFETRIGLKFKVDPLVQAEAPPQGLIRRAQRRGSHKSPRDVDGVRRALN